MKIVKEIKSNIVKVVKDIDFNNNLHIDFSDNIYYWYNYGIGLTDYVYARKRIKDIVINTGFNNIKYKEYAILVGSATDQESIGYLISTGLTQEEATEQHIFNMSKNYTNAGECYYNRLINPLVKSTIILFLGESQGLSLLEAVRNFKLDLKDVALLGTNYNNDRDGIMDYLEGTGSYDNSGITSYTIQQSMIDLYGDEATARQELINKLHFYIIDKFNE